MPRISKPGMTLFRCHCREWLYIDSTGGARGFHYYKAPDACPSCLKGDYSKALTTGHYTLYPVEEYRTLHPRAQITKNTPEAEDTED